LDALQRGASQGEIERLMNELQQALDRYLAAAAVELARRGESPLAVDQQYRILRSDDLKDLIETARQLARTGGRDAAMQMLAQLQRALDGIRTGLRQGGTNQNPAEAQELMKALRDLSDRQQTLLDESFRRLRDARSNGGRSNKWPHDEQRQRLGRGQASTPDTKAGAEEQQTLRKELGELMLRMDGFLGAIPAPLGEADQAMRGAVEALQRGRLGDAVPNQSQAADALGRALDAAGQAMAQRLGGMIGLSGQEGEEGGGSGDIFGRSQDGQRGFATGPLKIPERSELQRAQEILEELRRRAAERFRPRPELDYIDRLLRRF
jgi:tetratricopeptide (TPR) repeat protein